jgi:hypothetical protein
MRHTPTFFTTAALLALAAAPRVSAQTSPVLVGVTQQSGGGVHNPRELRATQALARRDPGDSAHVRFEWDSVSGAREYVLSGRWTSPPSWAVHTRQIRVNVRNAAQWTARRVTFETDIPEGNHSWSVVAVFSTPQSGGKAVADTVNPTTLSFDVR